jgi:hypothetical protein
LQPASFGLRWQYESLVSFAVSVLVCVVGAPPPAGVVVVIVVVVVVTLLLLIVVLVLVVTCVVEPSGFVVAFVLFDAVSV